MGLGENWHWEVVDDADHECCPVSPAICQWKVVWGCGVCAGTLIGGYGGEHMFTPLGPGGQPFSHLSLKSHVICHNSRQTLCTPTLKARQKNPEPFIYPLERIHRSHHKHTSPPTETVRNNRVPNFSPLHFYSHPASSNHHTPQPSFYDHQSIIRTANCYLPPFRQQAHQMVQFWRLSF